MPVCSHNVTQPLSINQVFCSNGMAFCGLLHTHSACANVVSASKQASKQAVKAESSFSFYSKNISLYVCRATRVRQTFFCLKTRCANVEKPHVRDNAPLKNIPKAPQTQ